MNTYSIHKTLQLWEQSLIERESNSALLKNLRSALKLYSFEGLGWETREMTKSVFERFCMKLSLEQWVQTLLQSQTNNEIEGELVLSLDSIAQFVNLALTSFDHQFDTAVTLGLTSPQTKRNYRSVLGRYLKWMVAQVWWYELFPQQLPEVLPEIPRGLQKPKFYRRGSLYGLRENQLPAHLVEELAEFREFRVTGGKKAFRKRLRQGKDISESRRPKLTPVNESSFERNEWRFILLFLGWCVNVNGDSLNDLSLNHLIDLERLQDYVDWTVEERQRSHCNALHVVKVSIAIAKWRTYSKTQRRNWSDIPIIQDLRDLHGFCDEEYQREKLSNLEEKWSNKELTHAEARQVVQYLRLTCASHRGVVSKDTGKRIKGTKRSDVVIVRAWQTYLIVKLLVYLPVRQQEIRQLKLGSTLFRKVDENGHPFYVALITDHKLKSKTQKNRHYRLPSILTQDLDDWLGVWRPKAVQAVASRDKWLDFFGHKPQTVERLQRLLEAARKGRIRRSIKAPQRYRQDIERRTRSLQKLVAMRETAKSNLETSDSLFFRFGSRGDFENFGQPLSTSDVYNLFRRAFATATQALFGQVRWVNPHAVRHIAAKHVRKYHGNREALAILMGHSPEMADDYAEQIFSEYEATQDFVNHWWEVD
jgi:hypothetical protein